jgi:hypothetical protein
MWFDHPGTLRRQLRSDLARQADMNRLKHSDERVVHLNSVDKTVQELVCPGVAFSSDSSLNFKLELEAEQRGWLIKRFKFSLHLVGRNIKMVRIHLNDRIGHDPVRIPRCHLHIDDSVAHIPFPIMNPRLMVHVICEHLEPDLGL